VDYFTNYKTIYLFCLFWPTAENQGNGAIAKWWFSAYDCHPRSYRCWLCHICY